MDIITALICPAPIYQPISQTVILYIWYFMDVDLLSVHHPTRIDLLDI